MRLIKIILLFLILSSIAAFLYLSYTYKNIPVIENTTSILILGKGGENHTASDLTDSILVVFLNPQTKIISMLSIPRDLWIAENRAKINASYFYDKEKGGNGFGLVKTDIQRITSVAVDSAAVIDFSLFVDVIDSIGGIKVNVENTFTDEKYPIAGKENEICPVALDYSCRYETITFEKGQNYMNGQTALKFVRSRNSKGVEGTDIAREKRQQIVIMAIKDKILSSKFLLDFKSVKNLYNVILKNLNTDITTQKLLSYIKFIVDSQANINYLSFPEELLVVSQNNKKYDLQYVFVPKSGSWKEIQEWVKSSI